MKKMLLGITLFLSCVIIVASYIISNGMGVELLYISFVFGIIGLIIMVYESYFSKKS